MLPTTAIMIDTKIAICVIFAVFSMAVCGEEIKEKKDNQATFLTKADSYRVVSGDTVILPCVISNLGSLISLWRRGPSVLTASSLMVVRDERFRLVEGYNLQINGIKPQDAGDYTCQISDSVVRELIHTVEVLVPPSVKVFPETKHITARKGEFAAMECSASGNPVPSVTWRKLNNSKTHVGDGQLFRLTHLERNDSGRYECVVNNGVGMSIEEEFQLQVLYPPEITTDKRWVHSDVGHRAELKCTVEADPPAQVNWHLLGSELSPSKRIIMSTRSNNHTLVITRLQLHDFGNYSCVANNELGQSRKYIEVSGRPGIDYVVSTRVTGSSVQYILNFVVESYSPLNEVRLLYRRVGVGNKYGVFTSKEILTMSLSNREINDSLPETRGWHDEMIALPILANKLKHKMTHEVKTLVPGKVYEAVVQAKNKYGWSEVSEVLLFHAHHHEARADELSPMYSSASERRLTTSAIVFALYMLFTLDLDFEYDRLF